ncbi:MAG: CocE/NonD family hydrolase [Ekhidna sp.]
MKFKGLLIGALLVLIVSVCYATKKEEIAFVSGDLRLSGTVMLPKGKGPFPAVVFLHGSGESTRDQNIWRAKKFVKNGYIALVYDKRGTGESQGTKDDWRYFSFDSLAQDAIAAIDYLKTRSDVKAQKIGIVAASQSGWVAPIVANKSNDVSFLIMISASVSTVAEDRLFERATRLANEGFNKMEVAEATEMQKLDQELTRNHSRHEEFKQLWEKNKNKAWFSRVYVSEYFLEEPSSNAYRSWFKTLIDFDPVPLLEATNIPILWLFGDSQLDRFGPVEQSLKRINMLVDSGKNFQSIQYPGSDHNLKGTDYFSDIFSWLQASANSDQR